MRRIVRGQRVRSEKVELVKRLRREMTPTEKILWASVRRNALAGFHFRRQQLIDGYIVDFYCHAAKLGVELDGSVHSEQVDYDRERDRILAARDLLVLRFKNEEVMNNLEGVLGEIEKRCRERT